MTKQSKKKAKSAAEPTDGSAIERALGLYNRMIDAVEAKIATGEVSATVLRDAAGIMRAAATLDGERRKAEAAERKRASAIMRGDVLAFARALDRPERAQLVRELEAIDSPRSVLS
jgi:hypothetical protein